MVHWSRSVESVTRFCVEKQRRKGIEHERSTWRRWRGSGFQKNKDSETNIFSHLRNRRESERECDKHLICTHLMSAPPCESLLFLSPHMWFFYGNKRHSVTKSHPSKPGFHQTNLKIPFLPCTRWPCEGDCNMRHTSNHHHSWPKRPGQNKARAFSHLYHHIVSPLFLYQQLLQTFAGYLSTA